MHHANDNLPPIATPSIYHHPQPPPTSQGSGGNEGSGVKDDIDVNHSCCEVYVSNIPRNTPGPRHSSRTWAECRMILQDCYWAEDNQNARMHKELCQELIDWYSFADLADFELEGESSSWGGHTRSDNCSLCSEESSLCSEEILEGKVY